MFSAFRQLFEILLRIPAQPGPPPGDEAKTQVFRAAPPYFKYLLFMWAVKTILPIMVLSPMFLGPLMAGLLIRSKTAAAPITGLMIVECVVIAAFLFLRVFALFLVRLDYEKRWYVITDRSLRVREGIARVCEATVTFANIQNISISQGPVQRMLGIADLRVETAGGGAATKQQREAFNLHTVFFRGVDNAEAIKELMQQRLRQLKDSGLGDHEEMITSQASPDSPNLLAALREVRDEAAGLRATAQRLPTVPAGFQTP